MSSFSRYKPFTGNFDFEHLIGIHRYIFRDIYGFAGEIREEDISKGHTLFSNCVYIRNRTSVLMACWPNSERAAMNIRKKNGVY